MTAYDARYLAVARDLGNPLVAEHAKLRKAAPALAVKVIGILGNDTRTLAPVNVG